MSNDDFNMSMRKFLKQVGVTSQQEIEEAIRKARDAGTLPAGEVKARMVLTMAHELADTDAKTGLLGICAAGGLGAGAVMEKA